MIFLPLFLSKITNDAFARKASSCRDVFSRFNDFIHEQVITKSCNIVTQKFYFYKNQETNALVSFLSVPCRIITTIHIENHFCHKTQSAFHQCSSVKRTVTTLIVIYSDMCETQTQKCWRIDCSTNKFGWYKRIVFYASLK